MLREREILSFYECSPLHVPAWWDLSRKHIRIQTYYVGLVSIYRMGKSLAKKRTR